MTLSVYVSGIGMLGPGFESWRDGVAILTGRKPYAGAPTVLPVPAMLPSAERRRTGRVVKLALAVALEATENAGADPTQLASVFSSSGADGHICHEICQALALAVARSLAHAFFEFRAQCRGRILEHCHRIHERVERRVRF